MSDGYPRLSVRWKSLARMSWVKKSWVTKSWVTKSVELSFVFFVVATGKLHLAAAQEQEHQESYQQQIVPLLEKYCLDCHNADVQEGGVRLDQFRHPLDERQLKLWLHVGEQVRSQSMPPAEQAAQPEPAERELLDDWISAGVAIVRARPVPNNGSVRRVTIAQLRHLFRDLLGVEEDLTSLLPPDTPARDGFLNRQETMVLSPLLIEAYIEAAEKALDSVLVDPASVPEIQSFTMELGDDINPSPCPDTLVLGANSHLLPNDDFLVTENLPAKDFPYQPKAMRTHYRFIEGYAGNDTVRGWRDFGSIYHAVFACMRGNEGYPHGLAYQTTSQGLLLRPAIPSQEIFEVESTYGPRANFKISLRELPDHGNFRVTVKAAKYEDGLLVSPSMPWQDSASINPVATISLPASPAEVEIATAGVYRITAVSTAPEPQDAAIPLEIVLGSRHFAGKLGPHPFLVVRLPAGTLAVAASLGTAEFQGSLQFSLVPDGDPLGELFARFEQRQPYLGVHLGLRRDCGSTLDPVGPPQAVESTELRDYVFEGAIANFPSPEVEADNVNYLAGLREIGVRSEYTDGREMPRLLIRSVTFEGPYHASWPPPSYRRWLPPLSPADDASLHAQDAQEVIRRFATQAFRRPVTSGEESAFLAIYREAFAEYQDFRLAIKAVFTAILASPQFLFLIEKSESPAEEELDDWELAAKLSFFLCNTMPDQQLLEGARSGMLRARLDDEIDRLIADPRFDQFLSQFVSQWLRLDKFAVVEIDQKRFPQLTRPLKKQLAAEPVRFVEHLLRENLSARHLIDADFIVASDAVARYYGLDGDVEHGFQFRPVPAPESPLGGLLTHAALLAGLSDGREANAVKRGAWLARVLLASPPEDPPPNVPAINDADNTSLSLREKLELHRNQKGCAGCHAKIDPWGIPFEEFDAGGKRITSAAVDARSILPDNTEVDGMNGLKAYLIERQIENVAYSFLMHATVYAIGRDLHAQESEELRKSLVELAPSEYPLRDVLRLVIHSKAFLKK